MRLVARKYQRLKLECCNSCIDKKYFIRNAINTVKIIFEMSLEDLIFQSLNAK